MSSPVDVRVKTTFVVEFMAGVRTRRPPSCIMTASEPPMVVVSLKVEMGEPGAGGGLAEEEEAGAGGGAPLE